MASAAVASAIPAPHTVPDGRSSRSNSNEVAFAPTDDIKRIADVNESDFRAAYQLNEGGLLRAVDEARDVRVLRARLLAFFCKTELGGDTQTSAKESPTARNLPMPEKMLIMSRFTEGDR